MKQEVPFTPENRPWLPPDCIAAMNFQFYACISQVPEESREALREWAAVKVEMGYCRDHPEITESCLTWGKLQGWHPLSE